MGNHKNKFNITKDKVVGEVKNTLGKITGNETLELKGKTQSLKSDINKKIRNKPDDIKEGVAGNINNMIDKEKK